MRQTYAGVDGISGRNRGRPLRRVVLHVPSSRHARCMQESLLQRAGSQDAFVPRGGSHNRTTHNRQEIGAFFQPHMHLINRMQLLQYSTESQPCINHRPIPLAILAVNLQHLFHLVDNFSCFAVGTILQDGFAREYFEPSSNAVCEGSNSRHNRNFEGFK